MSEKEFIISLCNKYIEDSDNNDSNKNISYFKDVLHQINENFSYVYEFIIGISENLILELFKEDGEDKKDFILGFNDLKSKIMSFNGDNSSIKLTDDENEIIDRFKELIVRYVNSGSNDLDDVKDFILRLNNNSSLLESDYDLVEKLIYLYEKDSTDALFEEAMDYLNRYNISLIRKFSKKAKTPVKYTKVGDSNAKIMEDIADKVNEIAESSGVNPFENMVSFEYVPKERSRVNRKKKIDKLIETKTVDFNSLFRKYNFNYDELHTNYKNKLNGCNEVEKLESFLEYLKDNTNLSSINNNGRILGLLLTESCKENFEGVNNILINDYNFSTEDLDDVLKRLTAIYLDGGLDNFKKNAELLLSCGVKEINKMVINNIMFFNNGYEDNYKNYVILKEMGINADAILRDALNVFIPDFDLLCKNIKVLDSYGFDLRDEEDFKSFSVLLILDLAKAIDMFIEMGYSEYIHDKPELTLRNIKSLIIKRILFAYKNGLEMWDNYNENCPYKKNDKYEEMIKNKGVLDEKEIDLLIKEYPILSLLDSGMRITTFNDPYFGSIRRKTELVFDNRIVSRIKTYSIFKCLTINGVNEKKALLYALSYNMDINAAEYESLKKVVYRDNEVSTL